jgi:hypothetical protein
MAIRTRLPINTLAVNFEEVRGDSKNLRVNYNLILILSS